MKAICRSIVVLLSIVAVGCAKTNLVVKAPEKGSELDGDFVNYVLPRGVVNLEAVGTVVTVSDPECLSHPAAPLPDTLQAVGIKRPDDTTPRKYLSLSGFKVTISTEPDPEQVYSVKLSSSGTSSLGLKTGPTGIPNSASSESTSTALQTSLAALKLVGTATGTFAFGPGALPSSKCQLIGNSLGQLAEEITKLDSANFAAETKEMLEYKRGRLTVAFNSKASAFTGVLYGSPAKIRCSFVPQSASPDEIHQITHSFFSWSPLNGVITSSGCNDVQKLELAIQCTADDASDELKELCAADEEAVVNVNIKILDGIYSKKLAQKEEKRSFFYRIPARTEIWASQVSEKGDKPLTARAEFLVPQLGEIASIPQLKSSSKAKVQVTFDPATGALIGLAVERSSADTARALDQIAALEQARQKAREPVDTELEELNRRKAVLEAMVAIEAAEATLNKDG